jgi:hypothetical protein
MKAEEMFKELGYEKKEESEGVLLYISDFENSILFDKKRVTITDLHGYGRITINRLLENAIHKQCEELGWLEEEKKTEMNIEHYYDKLTTFGMDGFAVTDGKVKACRDVKCSECEFDGGCCGEKRFIWLASPYKKSTYKLTQCEYDILNAYIDSGMRKFVSYYRALLELHEKGYFKDIDMSIPIHDILENCEVIER